MSVRTEIPLPIRSTAFSIRRRERDIDWSSFRPILLFGELQPKLRTQYTSQYNFGIQREIGKDLVLSVGYVGSQGHRLLATNDLNFGNAQTCLDLQNISDYDVAHDPNLVSCGPFFADSSFSICGERNSPRRFTLHLPYGSVRR